MNRFLVFVVVFLFSIVSFAQEKRSTFIKEQPLPMKVVNDFGKFLTKAEKDHLEKTLIAFRERKGYSVVIITLPGLTDNKGTEFTIEETAQLYFNRWGIGDNVKNDGVLILLSKQPRRIRIHTGSGMNTLLTNANCASIINQTMVPSFKADLYFTGLKDAVKDIETHIDENEALNKSQSVDGTSSATTGTQPAYTNQGVAQPREEMTFGKFMYGFITIVTLVWLYFRYRLKRARAGSSGVYSGGGYANGGNVFNNINRISNNNWGSGWGGSGRRRGWFNSGGSGSSSWFSGGSGNSSGSSSSSGSSDSNSSSSSSSGSASGSYGGGSSSGGGASGSW